MYQIGPQERANKRKIYEKNEKWKLSERTPQRRKSTKNLRKKTKNENHPKGHHKGANARKIYEKRKIIQEASKAYTNEKSTKKTQGIPWVPIKPIGIQCFVKKSGRGPEKTTNEQKAAQNRVPSKQGRSL